MNDGEIFGQKWLSGLVTLLAIFLPSFLLVWGALPFWTRLSASLRIRGAVMGVNAAVVGLLLAALYDPIWTGSVLSMEDFGFVLVLFGLLAVWKLPLWSVVAIAAAGGYLLEVI